MSDVPTSTAWMEADWEPIRRGPDGRLEFRTAEEIERVPPDWRKGADAVRPLGTKVHALLSFRPYDVFANTFPAPLRDQLYAAMVRQRSRIHLVSTAHPDRLAAYCKRSNHYGAAAAYRDLLYGPTSSVSVGDGLHTWPPPNVWHALRVDTQAEANQRIPAFLKVPGVRVLEITPSAAIDLSRWLHAFEISRDEHGNDLGSASGGSDLHWIRLEGESGPDARPLHPAWVRSIRDQCQAAGVPFRFSRWGEWLDIHQCPHLATAIDAGDVRYGEWHEDGVFTEGCICGAGHGTVVRVGSSGRTVDGQIWDQYPEVR